MAKTLKVSPLAPAHFPDMPEIAGLRCAVGNSGIRYKSRPDTLLMALDAGSTIAGVLTKSLAPSAPVDWCRKFLPRGKARGLVINSGNANAFTGKAGDAFCAATAAMAAKLLGAKPAEIFLSSTGIIGIPLPADQLAQSLPSVAEKLNAVHWQDAATAIMTTDTFPKAATRTAKIGGKLVRINGITKGSGMIAPDMATMLGYIFTDASLPAPVLRSLLREATDKSFNAITVDSDTSTSDTVLLVATQKVKHAHIRSAQDKKLNDFRRQLQSLCEELAILIVRDGEGATKLITIDVEGAMSDKAAHKIGLSIANSPLVKTAIAGEDPNWGRIVAAVGKAGEKADRDKLKIWLGGILVCQNGLRVKAYDEAPLKAHFQTQEIHIRVDIGLKKGEKSGRARIWTCDLTHAYIDINIGYRS